MFGSIGRALAWFIDGLVDAWIATAGRLRRSRRMAVVRAEDGYAVEQHDGKRAKGLLHLEAAENGSYFSPPSLAESLHNREVDLVLAADQVLVRTLDPLPADSRQYLDSIVHHQLDRVAPWRTDDVLHTYRVAPAESGDRLLVTVIATARSMHAQVLEALGALRPREIRLLCRDEQFSDEPVAIPVDRGASAAARHASLRRRAGAALALLLLAVVGGAGYMGWAWYEADAELTTVTQSIIEQRKRLMTVRANGSAGDQDLHAMIERRKKTPYAVLALDALSEALPDNTWLTELRLSDGRLRMTGISQNVASLVPLIEDSPAFAEATFFAPTSRLQAGQGDRFHLETRLVPGGSEKPSRAAKPRAPERPIGIEKPRGVEKPAAAENPSDENTEDAKAEKSEPPDEDDKDDQDEKADGGDKP